MATRQLSIMNATGSHEVGNLNSWKIRTVPFGANCTEDIDNFLSVELGFDSEGNRTCSILTDVTKKSYLIAAPENRMLGNVANEELVDFYNGAGEDARIVIFDDEIRFETSAFTLNAGVTVLANGQVAHFDPTTKKYIVSDAAAPHADYATAYTKFLVVFKEEDTDYTICGKSLVRLCVQK